MAKLKAPLLSLGAAGAIGKSIVFFPWKGLDVAREYVVPANPKTDPQNTQRGYLTAAVTNIHVAQGAAANPLDAEDISACALLGSCEPTPRTWFNTIVKQWVDQKVASLLPAIWRDGHLTPGAAQLTFLIAARTVESSAPTSGKIRYGTSKTALNSSLTATIAEIQAGKVIPGLTNGVKYYAQYRPDTPVTFIGADSGIYYGTPAA